MSDVASRADLDRLFVGYGNGAISTKWYAMNPWKTEYRTGNNADTAHMTTMTATGIKHGNIGIGIAAPKEKLDVNGNVQVTGMFKGNGTVPLGGIIMWSGAAAPSGWAICDGSIKNGYKTPDLRGRFVVGYNSLNADYDQPGNLSAKGTTVGEMGGAKTVTLTTAQMPSHNHSGTTTTNGNHRHTAERCGGWAEAGGSYWQNIALISNILTKNTSYAGNHWHYLNINNTGGNQAHENRPPYYTLAYIMRVY